MNKKKIIIIWIFLLLVAGSTCVVIDNKEKQQAEFRQDAFTAMNRLQNDASLTVEQAEACAIVIHRGVRAHAVTYQELGVGSYFTIEEMVKHVEWGNQMKITKGY